MPETNLPILIVDDSAEDVELIAVYASRVGITNPIIHRSTGRAALDYLDEPRSQLPGLILMDIRMPGLDGHETLSRIRAHQDRRVRMIPVVVMSTSDADSDVARAYSYYANSYIVKPPDGAGLTVVLQLLKDYWLGVVKLPTA